MSESSVKLERISDRGYLNLRGVPEISEFVDAVHKIAGVKPPVAPNTVAGESPMIFWLGPNEWLLVDTAAAVDGYAVTLSEAMGNQFAAVNDLSGGTVCYRLSGESARDLLSKGCSLDLHPAVFETGSCAQTGLAKAAVLLTRSDGGASFDIIVRRSFSDYLWRWLMHAGNDFGIAVA